jgi:hypothetical protein
MVRSPLQRADCRHQFRPSADIDRPSRLARTGTFAVLSEFGNGVTGGVIVPSPESEKGGNRPLATRFCSTGDETMAILPTPEPIPTPVPTPPIPGPKPMREPDPDRLPDENPVPNPDENDIPPKRMLGGGRAM